MLGVVRLSLYIMNTFNHLWKRSRYTRQYLLVWFRRYYLIFVIGLALGVGFFWALPRVRAWLPAPREVKRIGLVGLYDESNLPNFIVKNVSIGLTQVGPDGIPYPGIAKSWVSDEEGRVWRFEIDPNIAWSNQMPVLANDIGYRFSDVEMETLGDRTLQFRLPDPFAPFPVVVSKPIFKGNFLGLGPYKLTRVTRSGQALQFLEFMPISKKSSLPVLRYRFYPTEDSAKLAFKLGEIDEIVSLIDPTGFEGWNNVEVTSHVETTQQVTLFFNTEHPDLNVKAIRQALAYAIEDKAMGYTRSISAVPEQSWAYNPNVKTYDYDLERAKELLGLDENSPEMNLTITTVLNLLDEAEQIKQDWEALGVNVEVKGETVVPRDFDVLLITQEVPLDPDQYTLWHSTQENRVIAYQNPRIDQLLENGRKTIDRDERKEIYQDFQRFLNEDLPAVFLFHPETYTIKRV